jgi:Domain of unknown function (DUF2828)
MIASNKRVMSQQFGENGTLEFTDHGLGSKILALSQVVRGAETSPLVNDVLQDGSVQDLVDLIVLTFATRNSRGGKGERLLSYRMFLQIWCSFPETMELLLELFPHYGYWKDLLLLIQEGTAMKESGNNININGLTSACIRIIRDQFLKDVEDLEAFKEVHGELESPHKTHPKLSLLAKWLPRESSSLNKRIDFVKNFIAYLWPEVDLTNPNALNFAKMRYRKMVTELTSYHCLPEVLLSAHREEEINFGRVASKATFNLRKVFINEDKAGKTRSDDPKRIRMAERFIEHAVNNGLNGKQLMPHEIVTKILSSTISKVEEIVLQSQWESLWKDVVAQIGAKSTENGIAFNPTRMLPLCDVSGSMSGEPMNVAIALSIGISEITHPAFRNMVVTFESNPRFHLLNETDTIVQKVRSLAKAPWGGSTNFAKAYDLLLGVARSHRLNKCDLPSLIVFSDMQFDQATSEPETVYQSIRNKTASLAEDLQWEDIEPSPIVFWNLRNTGGRPVDKGTEGAVLLSGFSPSLLKLVMDGEALKDQEIEVVDLDGNVTTTKVRVTPEEILRKMLDDNLYDPVRVILAKSGEGKLCTYAYECSGSNVEEDFLVI